MSSTCIPNRQQQYRIDETEHQGRGVTEPARPTLDAMANAPATVNATAAMT
jgi:hypothetical protein